MTRQVSRRGTVHEVDNRPLIRKPAGAMIAVALLAIDWRYLHIVHHLLGSASGLVVTIVFLMIVARVGWWLRRIFW